MLKSLPLLLLYLTLTCCGQAQEHYYAASSSVVNPGSWTSHEARDPQLNNMVAWRYEFPSSWRVSSSVNYDRSSGAPLALVYVRGFDPQNGSSLEMLPSRSYSYHHDMYLHTTHNLGYTDPSLVPYQSPATCFKQHVQPLLRGVSIDSVINEPMSYDGPIPMQKSFMLGHDQKGNEVGVAVINTVSGSQSVYTWSSQTVIIRSKPAYSTDLVRIFHHVLAHAKIDPQWNQAVTQRINQATQRMQDINTANHNETMKQQRDNFETHNAIVRAREQMSDEQFAAYMDRSSRDDQMHERYVDGIHEQQRYTDQSGGQHVIQGYDQRAFTDGSGNYITTDDWFYNPNQHSSQHWEELHPKQYDRR